MAPRRTLPVESRSAPVLMLQAAPAGGILSEAQTDIRSKGPSTNAHIYPSVLQAVPRRGYVGRLWRVI
jgi:hypothetical protein